MPRIISIHERTLLQKIMNTGDEALVPLDGQWVITGCYVLPGPGYKPPSAEPRDGAKYGDIYLCIGDRIVHQMNAMTMMDSWYIRSVSRVNELSEIIGGLDNPAHAQAIEKFVNSNPHLIEPMRWQCVIIPEKRALSFRRRTSSGQRINEPLQVEVWIDRRQAIQ